jgi:hypothetical protein
MIRQCFVVTSAVNSKFGVYNSDERLAQTVATLNNVRAHAPGCKIIVMECAGTPLTPEQSDTLEQNCDLLLDFCNDPDVKAIYQSDNWDIVKNTTEIMCFGRALRMCQDDGDFEGYDRIHKMSGRYLLNDDFDIQDYQSKFLEGKYIVKRYEYLSQEMENYDDKELENVYAYLYGAKGMMVTGLWSFDRVLFTEIVEALEKAFVYMEKMLQFTAGTDVEHSLYRFINKKNIIDIPNLGLTVVKGMSGENGGVYHS